MRFLHCSDVHITGNYRQRSLFELGWRRWPALGELSLGGRGHSYQHAPRTLKSIADDAKSHRADHLIVSGDLTAYALEEEFDGAKAALAGWVEDRQKCTVIHGNHDVYTPGAVRAQRFERRFGHLLESDLPEYQREGPYPFVRLLGEGAAVVGLLSARVPLVPGFSFGWIGKAQLDGLSALVADQRMKHRGVLVAVHHAPLKGDGTPDRPLHGLRDAQELFRRIPGERFAVLHGHIHRRYHHPATAARPHIFGAGSSTMAGREGYWLIEVENGRIGGSKMCPVGGLA
jgi:3',5'-cyclic AMP phosphodiesterase CpdA